MSHYGPKTLIFILLIGSVCYTSIRLVNITTELQDIRERRPPIACVHVVDFTRNTPSPTRHPHVKHYSSFLQFADSSIDCLGVFEGNANSITQALSVTKRVPYVMHTDHEIYTDARECRTFISKHGYADHVISQAELDFPIAYSILVYKEIAQLNVLLKAIYRQHNLYCIHVDGNSGHNVHLAAKAIADCFSNVFIASKTEKVVYAGITRLQADLNCMDDLYNNSVKWKYVINLPSQEYPLKTNQEIVKILKIYNGSNDIEGITGSRKLHNRYIYKYIYIESDGKTHLSKTKDLNPQPPHNITIIKGSAYGIFSRAFVDFVLNDPKSKDLLRWCRGVLSPDEYFWATLNHNPSLNAPGGYAGKPDEKPWLAAYASWHPAPCHGLVLRGVCAYSVGDLPMLASRPELFANKFIMSTNPVAVMCMEEWIENRTASTLPFDMYYYQTLPFIKK